MIVRILGEGQYHVADQHREQLDQLDNRLQAAADQGDEDAFASTHEQLLITLRQLGSPLPDIALTPSELDLPTRTLAGPSPRCLPNPSPEP